ncbi:efflux RND transporter periplasmic adaptor subunit [Geofilum rubicundum]|uniref:Cation efflux system protein n=1 Tax=Geofilum rubicundum JCM 15548 TaxID=1236989 RepID=A0A0E9LWN0_9BACT|nr:efflux RND transporter periplasmic adaptor subunit [Geofilum rubicundum]GAO29659.1 cation efflux system protein [Geofilum rubicundum JCM 15548]
MKARLFFSTIAVTSLFLSCNHPTGGHEHDGNGGLETEDHEAHDNPVPETQSFTLFSDAYELFVEFPALTVGQTSIFAAHLTQLDDYQPVTKGQLTVSIVKDGKGLRHRVESPASQGIFRPALQPKEAGNYQLKFELESPSGKASFEIPDIPVYGHANEASHATEDEHDADAISFLKEQAWKTDFATQEIKLQPFYSVIHTSAKVKGQALSSLTLNAQTEGQVKLMVVPGQKLQKGDLVAVVASTGIENSLDARLTQAQIAFNKSKTDYLRTKQLVEKQVISEKDFLAIETQYQQDSLRYYQLANQVSGNGLKITSPIDGFVSHIAVRNGQFVDKSSVLMDIGSNQDLRNEAYVNASDFQKVSEIFDATFSLPDDKEALTLEAVRGQLIAQTPFVSENHSRIPITFAVQNNGRLMNGMYLEAFLKTGKKDQALVVPLSAIIEEQGQYFVFVQTGGESFVKRPVQLANNDGIQVEITSGLAVGERIVTQGAYQIKLAAMSGDLPIHGHTH